MKINPTSSIYKSSNKNLSKSTIPMNKKQQQQKDSSDKFIDILKSQIGKDTNNNKIKK